MVADDRSTPLLTRSLATSSWTWHAPFYQGELSVVDIPAAAQAAGIDQVELNDFMLPPGRWSRTRNLFRTLFTPNRPKTKQQRYRQSTIDQISQQLNQHAVSCISWSIESDLTVSAKAWEHELAYITTGMRTAVQLNAHLIRLTIGGSAQMGAQIDQQVIGRLRQIAALCHKQFPTLRPVVENHWGLTTDIGRFLKILAAVPTIGLCFDPGNIPPADRETAWPQLARQADHVHLKIIDYHPEKLDSDIDYRTIFQQLAAHNYTGKLVIEYEGDHNPADLLKQVKSQLAHWPYQPFPSEID